MVLATNWVTKLQRTSQKVLGFKTDIRPRLLALGRRQRERPQEAQRRAAGSLARSSEPGGVLMVAWFVLSIWHAELQIHYVIRKMFG